MKLILILGILITTSACLTAANIEEWLKSGLLHPDLITSIRDELALTDEQQAKLSAQLEEARKQAAPLEKIVTMEQKALLKLLTTPDSSAETASAQLAKLIEAEAAVKQLQLRTLIGARDVLTPEQQQKARKLGPPKMAAAGTGDSLEPKVTAKAQKLRTALETLGVPPTEAMKERGGEIEQLISRGQFAAADQALDKLIDDSHFKELELEAEPEKIDFTKFEPGSTDIESLRERHQAVQDMGQQIISLPLIRELLQAKAAFEEAKAAQDAEQVGRILTFVESKLRKE